MILRLLNLQGIVGIAVSLCLALLLVVQKGETRQWKRKSGQHEQLYRAEQSAFSQTVANYRAAADRAHTADRAAAARVAAEQRAINERTAHDFKTRLAAARARANAVADRLRVQAQGPAADSGPGGASAMPGLSAASGRADQAAGQDGLPHSDRLTATEQAIQLDELIKWIRNQAAVDPNGDSER